MKAHIGFDADSGLGHTVNATGANEHGITRATTPLHGLEKDVVVNLGYRGVGRREETHIKKNQSYWHVAIMPGKRKALNKVQKYAG